MKQIFTLITFLYCLCTYGQKNNLEFLKSSKHAGEPNIIETIKWLENNLILNIREEGLKHGMSYRIILKIDNTDGERLFEIPCNAKFPFFEYSALQNTISFRIDNMGCYAGAFPIESATVTILLDNLNPWTYIGTSGTQGQRLDLKSWNSKNRGTHQGDDQFYSDYELGYIIWDNFDDCSGKRIKTFGQLSFPLEIKEDSLKTQFENAIKYLAKKCSAFGVKCHDFGACFVANSKVSINKSETKNINLLSKGNKILSYDLDSKKLFETEILNIDSVYHNNLTELYFDDDTITCTDDHPFYIDNKGWCSLVPEKTLSNYSNYNNIGQIKIGDLFLYKKGDKLILKKLIRYSYKGKEDGVMTYTITNLKQGNTYFVNGILTGVENFKNLSSINLKGK
jgi:Ataxin-1 and HBP1 module (AXH)